MPLAPIDDYTFKNVPDPAENLRKNIESTIMVAGAQQKAQAAAQELQIHNQQIQENQYKIAQQQRLRTDMDGYLKDPTPEAAILLSKRHPDLSEHIKQNFDMQNEQDKKTLTSQALKIHMAMEGGADDVVINKLEEFAQHDDGAGNKGSASMLRGIADLYGKDPLKAKGALALVLASVAPEHFAKSAETIQNLKNTARKGEADAGTAEYALAAAKDKAPYVKPLAAAEVKAKETEGDLHTASAFNQNQEGLGKQELRPSALSKGKDAARLSTATTDATLANDGVAKDVATERDLKAAAAGEAKRKLSMLPEATQTKVDEYEKGFNKAQNDTNEAFNVAVKLRKYKAGLGGGVIGKGLEYFKSFKGGEDQYTTLKNQYTTLADKARLAGLHDGRIPAAMLDMVESHFPDENANPEEMAQAAERIGRATQAFAKWNRFNADWYKYNLDGQDAKKSFKAAGMNIKEGTPYSEALEKLQPYSMPKVPDNPGLASALEDAISHWSTTKDPKMKEALGKKIVEKGGKLPNG